MENSNGDAESCHPDFQDAQMMSSLAETIAQGKCILFLGAAVHCAPPDDSKYKYEDNDRPCSTGDLSARLALKTGGLYS